MTETHAEETQADTLEIKQLRIGHHDYKLEDAEDLRNDDDNKLYGQILYNEKRIQLNREFKNNKQVWVNTIIHEAVHGMFSESTLQEEAENEELVERFSNTLHGFLKDNIDAINAMYGNGDEEIIEVRGYDGKLISKERVIH